MNSTGLIRLILLAIGIIGVTFLVMPQTVSLFAGQHTWYNLSGEANDLPCEKCHGDVYEEMMSMEPLSKKLAGQSSSPHSYMDENCELCHRTCFNNTFSWSSGKYEKSPGFTYASGSGTGSTPGVEAHAASIIECMDCHGIPADDGYWEHWSYAEYSSRCFLCHGGSGWYRGHYITIPSRGWSDFISAGGFGLGTTETDTGEKAAHRQFVLDAINNSLMEDANEACIACHTENQVRMEFNVSTGVIITVNNSYTQTSSYWSVSDITPSNYTTYVEVKS
ncbi:MAG TPA: hypothetical protein ENI32_06585 [Candidatus Syntrophoarchaeum butanivorans]|nr:hypothetical protein [Candidatus Syntrophoarchaeum butanivorans]